MERKSSAVTFPSTCWSRIVAARDRAAPEAREALAELCAAYWYPIYAFIRRKGNGAERRAGPDAGLFRPAARSAARSRRRTRARVDSGRFCWPIALASSLTATCTLMRRSAGAAWHRCRSTPATPKAATSASPRTTARPSGCSSAAWALALLDGVLVRLRREYEGSDRGAAFDALKVVLTDGPGRAPCRAGPAAWHDARCRSGGHPPPSAAVPRSGPRGDCRHRRRRG